MNNIETVENLVEDVQESSTEQVTQETTVKNKNIIYSFTCLKCGTLVNVNTDNSLTVSDKKSLHKCPRK